MTSVLALRDTDTAAAGKRSSAQVSEVVVLCLLALLLPSDLNLPFGGATLYAGEIAVAAAALGVLLLRLGSGRSLVLSSPFLATMAAYLAWAAVVGMVALLMSGDTELLGKCRTIAVALVLAGLCVEIVDTRRKLEYVLVATVAGLALNAALGVLQFGTGTGYFVGQHENNQWKVDLSGNLVANTANGLFITPNNLGVALIPGILLGLALVVTALRRGLVGRPLAIGVLMVVMALALALTFNRGAYVWAAVGLALLILPSRFKLAQAALALILVTMVLTTLATRDMLLFQDTLVVRLRLWLAALEVFNHNDLVLILGNGMVDMPYWGAVVARWELPTSHNTWLDQVLLFGVPGLLIYLAMWIVPLVAVARSMGRHPFDARLIGCALVAALTATAGASFFEPRAEGFYQVTQVALLLALATVHARLNSDQP